MKKILKGESIICGIGQIKLVDSIRIDHSQYDQAYFLTNQQSMICKIYNILNEPSIIRYQRERQIYDLDLYPNLVKCISKSQFTIKKVNYALLVFSDLPKNSALNQIGTSLSSFQLLKLTKTILELLKALQQRKQVFLNLRPQNILLNSQKNFVIMNPEFISEKGTHSQLQELNELFFSNVEKYFKYNSPEVLDNYTYFPIDSKSDIFSLGCILYEIIYGKYPFESKFANINIIYEKQEGFFGKFIEKIFKPYKERADVDNLLTIIEDELKKNPSEPKQTNTSSTAQSRSPKHALSFFDDISSVFNKYTKETEGAYMNFTEDNESFPQIKHLNFILNKLYKNPNKIEKLQSTMTKHIKSTEYGTRKNFVIKNLVLILLVLRKNRNYMIANWKNNITEIKQVLTQNSECLQFCELLLRKIQLQQDLNCILRGNFYLEDVCQFKHLNVQNLIAMTKYMEGVLVFANKLVGYKDEDYLYFYVLEVMCDEIFDLISMIIMSVIAIRKDNQLGLRKDNLADLTPLEKGLQVMLKKISNLSNKVSSHAIYSMETDYYSYKEDIQLKENPQHTSFEYFVKHCNYYKGLALPESNNFSSLNQSDGKADFASSQANKNKSQPKNNEKKFFGNQMSSDQDEPVSSMNQIPLKNQSSKNKNQPQLNPKAHSAQIEAKSNALNLFGNNPFQYDNLKKAKSTEKPLSALNIQNKSTQNKQTPQNTQEKSGVQKMGFDDFSNFFAEVNKKPPLPEQNKKQSNASKSIESKPTAQQQNSKPNDIFQNFSFFQEQSNKRSMSPSKNQKQQKSHQVLNWVNFNEPGKKSESQKPGIKIDPNILKEDIFSYDWLKKSEQNPFGIFVQVKENKAPNQQKQPEKLSPFVSEIITALRLKELKDLIVKNSQVVIEFQKLVFDKVIGSGSAGQVYLGKFNNQAVAIKKVKIKENPNALKEFERELVTYIKIKKNPALVSLVGLSKSGQDFYLLTEFCSSGSLFDLLHKKANQIFLSWKVKMSLIIQIAKGMKALHDMRPAIIHRDLKSLNVFISFENNQWIAKVADFGLSRSPQAEMMTMALGTLHWMAPQLLDNKQYSLKVDVYSFAVVMWEICARRTPYFELSNPMAIMKYVTIDKKRPNMTIIDVNCPPKLLDLIQICWQEDPEKRPNFNQILQVLTAIDNTVPNQ